MRVLSTQLRRNTTPNPTTATESKTPNNFAWPSGNSYDVKRSYGKNKNSSNDKQDKDIPTTKQESTNNNNNNNNNNNTPSKPFFVKGAASQPKQRDFPPPSPIEDDSDNDDDDASTATSATAQALHEAAQHCVKGQELVSSASSQLPSTSQLYASIKEYQSALYILEKTIGSGFTNRREYRSLLVMSQIFYWMGLAFEKLAACHRTGSPTKYQRKDSSDVIAAALETHERNAIQSYISCLKLRYHLLDRKEEKRDESEMNEDTDIMLENFVSPLMEIQLVLTNLWESSPSPFCNMTPLESAHKLQRLRIAIWNEDKGDEYMFAIAGSDETTSFFPSTSSNLNKALGHYRKALETFSDENHKNELLSLKIASCYRQSGLRKMKTDDNEASKDFDASVFWYQSALKSFCATVRFDSQTVPQAFSKPQKPSLNSQGSVSSIDMSETCSLADEFKESNTNGPTPTNHPTYEQIVLRIEEILTWKQHQQQLQKQRRKYQTNKGAVSGAEGTIIEQETTKRDYLHSKMKESIYHQRVENLVEENKRLRTALDGTTGTTMETSQNSHSIQYQQKSGEPSNDSPPAAAKMPVSPLRGPVEFVDIFQSQNTNSRASDTYFVPDDAKIPSKIEHSIEGMRHNMMARCRSLEQELTEANAKIVILNQEKERDDQILKRNRLRTAKLEDQISTSAAEAQKAKDENALLTDRLVRINDELKESKELLDSRKQESQESNDTLLKKYEAALEELKDANSNLESSKRRCVELEHLETKTLEEKARLETQCAEYLDRCKQAEADLSIAKSQCRELESDKEKHDAQVAVNNAEERAKLESENADILKRYNTVELELEISRKRCDELETKLEKQKELLEARDIEKKFNFESDPKPLDESEVVEALDIESKFNFDSPSKPIAKSEIAEALDIESKFNFSSPSESLETSGSEESVPDEDTGSKGEKLEAENNRLEALCKDFERELTFTKDQNEMVVSGLRMEVTRAETELRIAKDEYTALKSQLDEMKNMQTEEKVPFEIRIGQLEEEIKTVLKESEDTKLRLETERDELEERMKNEQQLNSVMAQEHEMSILALKKEVKTAVDGQKEGVDRIEELEKELEQERMSNKTTTVKAPSEDDNKVSSLDKNVNIPEQEQATKEESLSTRVAELMKEIEIAKEQGVIEREKVEQEHLEKMEKEQSRAKELEKAIEEGKKALEEAEIKFKEMEVKDEINDTISNLEQEKLLVERKLDQASEEREIEFNRAQVLQTRVSDLEKANEELKLSSTDYDELKSRLSDLEEAKRLVVEELKDMTDAKEKATDELKTQQDSISKLEEDLADSARNASEQNGLLETISELKAEVQVLIDENRKISSQLESSELIQQEKDEKHDIVSARCLELENELKERQKIEADQQDRVAQEISDLQSKLEVSTEKNAEILSDLELLQAEQELYVKLKEEHRELLARFNQIENQAEESQLQSDKNITLARQSLDDLKADLAAVTAENENLSNKIEAIVKEKEMLVEQSTALEEKSAAEQSSSTKDVERLEKELESTIKKNREEKEALAERILSLEEEMENAKGSNEKLASDLRARDDEGKDMKVILESRTSELEASAQKIIDLENQLDSISTKNKTFVAKKESFEQEARESHLKVTQVNEECAQLMEELASSRADLASSTSTNEDLLLQIKTFENEQERFELGLKENEAERKHFNDRIAEFEKEMDSKIAENKALSTKVAVLDEMKEENVLLSSRVSSLKNELQVASAENNRLSNDNEQLKKSETEKKLQLSRVSELERELQSTLETNRKLHTDIKHLEAKKEEATHLKTHIAGIESELQSLLVSSIGSLKTKEEENNRLTENLSQIETELDGMKSTNRDLAVQVASLEKKEEENQHDVDRLSEVEIENEALERMRQALEVENKSLQEAKDELLSRVSNLEGELESSRKENQSLITETGEIERNQDDRDHLLTDLKTKLESSGQTNNELTAEIGTLIKEISDLEAKLDDSEAANETLSSEVASLRTQQVESQDSMDRVSSLEQDLSDTKEKNEVLSAELESFNEQKQEYDRMKVHASSLEKEIKQANVELDSQKERFQIKEEENVDLVKQLAKLENDLDLKSHENNRLNEERNSLKVTITSIKNDLNDANEKNDDLHASCTEQESALEVFRKKIDAMNAKFEEGKKLIAEKDDLLRKEKEDADERCTHLEELVKESMKENKEITSLLRQKSSQIVALNQTVDKMEDLQEKASDYDFIANQCKELEEELMKTMGLNEELNQEIDSLKEEMDTLNMTIFDTEVDLKEKADELKNAQKSNKGLAKRCESLKKELGDVKDQYRKLEEKIAYPDAVEDGQEWTRLQLTELENRMEDVKNENEVLENRMEDIMEENELLLSRLQEYKSMVEQEKTAGSTKSDDNLADVCKELEKELLATAEMNDSLRAQIESFDQKIDAWKEYAENIENELEQETEALQEAEQKNADLLTAMNILEQQLEMASKEKEKIVSEANQDKESVVQLLEMQGVEHERISNQCSVLKSELQNAKKECRQAKADVTSLIAAKKDLQNMLEEAVQDIHELEESSEKLNAVILAKNEMKKLLDRAELGRDEINEKYGRCKRELNEAKESLEEAHAEKENLIRELNIEKKVSSAYKSEDENEFDDLYRAAQKEMNDMDIMLQESRECVSDLEENVQILQHQLQAALTFKLQQTKAKPRPNRQFFGGWRGGNKNQSKEQNSDVVTDDDMGDENDEEVVEQVFEEELL